MIANIFYSWQSDLPNETNRNYLEAAIKSAIKKINKEKEFVAYLDKDTKNKLGSPNIVESVLEKIEKSKLFVCDVSFVKENMPNANVLIELGYAVKKLGWNRVICLFNSNTGKIENLPFDISHNRITQYNPDKKNEKEKVVEIIYSNLKDLFRNGLLYNPIEDYVKRKIDYYLINTIRNIANIFSFDEKIDFRTYLADLDKKSSKELEYILLKTKTLGFYILFNYENYRSKLEEILQQLFGSNYFNYEWCENIILFIDWFDNWNKIIDFHFSPNLLKVLSSTDYSILDSKSANLGNERDSVVLWKRLKNGQYKVIQKGYLSKYNYEQSAKLVSLNEKYSSKIVEAVKQFISYLDR